MILVHSRLRRIFSSCLCISRTKRAHPNHTPRALGTGRLGLLIFCVAIGVLACALCILLPRLGFFQAPAATPEKVIPEQTLQLVDGSGKAIARINAGGGGFSVMDFGGLRVMAYEDDHASIIAPRDAAFPALGSTGRDRISDVVNEMTITMNRSGKLPMQVSVDWGQGRRMSLFKNFMALEARGLLASIRERIHAFKPQLKPVRAVVPTQEVRLVDRRGWEFATLGLTASGDPSVAFTDRKGGVLVVWTQRHGLGSLEPDWWNLALYESDKLRVSVELKPGKPLALAIFDNSGTLYGLNLHSEELALTLGGRSEIPELKRIDFAPRRPVRLVDDRGHQLWKAPSQDR